MTNPEEPQTCQYPDPPAAKVLDASTVASISSFVEHQSANVQQMLATMTDKQAHRTVEVFVQNLFDFVLELMPPTKQTANFISEWVYNFYAQVKSSQEDLVQPSASFEGVEP